MHPSSLGSVCRFFRLFVCFLLLILLGSFRPNDHGSLANPWMNMLMQEVERAGIEVVAGQYPVLAEWIRQDLPDQGLFSRGTVPPASISYLEMTRGVLGDIRSLGGNSKAMQTQLQAIRTRENPVNALGESIKLYLEACEKRRSLRLRRLVAETGPIVFAEHANFKMSSVAYTEGLSDARRERFFEPGSRLSILTFEGTKGTAEHLVEDPHGIIRDVDASPDGEHLIFAWKKSDRLDDYHIYEYHLASGDLKQLTRGIGRADYEPAYLPDGDIVFTSTRPEQNVPSWWAEGSNLYRMNPEGYFIRRLTVDQAHALYPQVLENGRVVYSRWEYNDRAHVFTYPLFSMKPDGSDQRVYYGGNSWFPTSLLHARAIPGTGEVMAIAAGHHTRQHGKLVIIDIEQGQDEGMGIRFLGSEANSEYRKDARAHQEGNQYRYPYPLNEREFLVSFLPEDHSKRYPDHGDNGVYGLYWMDVDGNRELLYADEKTSVGRVVPLYQQFRPDLLKDSVDYTQQTGMYYLHNVYEGPGLEGIARGTAKKIRVVRLDFRAAGVGMTLNKGEGGNGFNSTPIAIANGSWDVKEILGEADIYEDGSALFEVPAMQAVYFQVLDEKRRVIQTMRSWDTVRPGERKACRGCHVGNQGNYYPFQEESTMAWNQDVQALETFYGQPRGFDFTQEIQPILDRHCISCHDGSRTGVIDLRGEVRLQKTAAQRSWTESYLNLTGALKRRHTRGKYDYYIVNPEEGPVSWISKMSGPGSLPPYSSGAANSELLAMLEKGHYEVDLNQEAFDKLSAWLDLLVPFSGDYQGANDWSWEELAYYNYYEEKRRNHREEELANIRDWILAKGNKTAARILANSNKEKETVAGYRSLEGLLSKGTDQTLELSFGREVMLDRIEIEFDVGEQGLPAALSVLVTLSDQTSLRKEFAAGDRNFVISLGVPRSTQGLLLDAKGTRPAPSMLALQAWGRDMSELPYFEAYHPYLQLGDSH